MKVEGEKQKAEGPVAAKPRATNHQSRITNHAFLVTVLTATLALGGCDYLPFGYTSAKEISAAPANFEGKEVKVKGKVKGSMKLLGMRAFTVQDGTGEIAVTTGGELPAEGSEVAVKGTVKSTAIISGASMGLRIEETKRLR